jgi:ketosteroid isomerase-like protein
MGVLSTDRTAATAFLQAEILQAMPKENVEIVREVYERWSEGDFHTTPVLDPQVVFILRPDFPEAGAYVGTEALAGYMHGFLEPWTHVTIEAEEVIEAGDTVVVGIVQRAEGDASGAATEFRYFQLWSFRGGRVIRLENVRDRAEALAAAGLSG